MASLTLVASNPTFGCSIVGEPLPEQMVVGAELIVRAKALGYTDPPTSRYQPEWVEGGEIATKVMFEVLEVLEGRHEGASLQLSGVLTDQDDYNDTEVPYGFVRPGGRRGNCWAFDYREGAEYLLFLVLRNGSYTVNWYPLGAVNEQLRGPDDAWLHWVEGFLAAVRFLSTPDPDQPDPSSPRTSPEPP